MNSNLLRIDNDGETIAFTNYFDTAHAQAGLVFLSWNAGAARLLVPDNLAPIIVPDLRDVREVFITRGRFNGEFGYTDFTFSADARTPHGREAIEVIFDDGSDAPKATIIESAQCDRLLLESSQEKIYPFLVVTRSGEQLRLSCRHRVVEMLPCVTPWVVPPFVPPGGWH
jgi:hypothetical protein